MDWRCHRESQLTAGSFFLNSLQPPHKLTSGVALGLVLGERIWCRLETAHEIVKNKLNVMAKERVQ